MCVFILLDIWCICCRAIDESSKSVSDSDIHGEGKNTVAQEMVVEADVQAADANGEPSVPATERESGQVEETAAAEKATEKAKGKADVEGEGNCNEGEVVTAIGGEGVTAIGESQAGGETDDGDVGKSNGDVTVSADDRESRGEGCVAASVEQGESREGTVGAEGRDPTVSVESRQEHEERTPLIPSPDK